ncbi:probable carboxylesterase 2 [Tripterygium wilfordii]|uniref:probable carboxylesterase 2 n=1 Tax=Tripterygium wilfordii TaxID=458696 RepID=UPI0018F857A7|nr:probable carboxylesterase 2 [Tripterygium wilfordii]
METQIVFQIGSHFRAFKDGHIERFFGTDIVPASTGTTVSTKDVQIVPETGVSARVFIPNSVNPDQKLPLLVYFHGGAFLVGSPFCAEYHNFVSSLVAQANVVAVSIEYRLAPENPVPIAYEDSWAALKWVASHDGGVGHESWLTDYADFSRVFVAGDSAGANIAHNMALQAGLGQDLCGVKLSGICLIHPYFERKGADSVNECWAYVCPTTSGINDTRINPFVDSRLCMLGCGKVLVCIAEKDFLRGRGLSYYETLKETSWAGEVEIFETEGEKHVFHLFNPGCDKAVALLNRLSSFLNQIS